MSNRKCQLLFCKLLNIIAFVNKFKISFMLNKNRYLIHTWIENNVFDEFYRYKQMSRYFTSLHHVLQNKCTLSDNN